MRMLDRAVELAPADPEIRFLRFAVADATPGFLGFRTNIHNDAEMVIAALEHGRVTPSCPFWRQVLATLSKSGAMGPGHTLRLRRITQGIGERIPRQGSPARSMIEGHQEALTVLS